MEAQLVKLKPIVQTSLVKEVAGRLRGLVESGNLNAGDRLPSEPELVERLQVSRTVLREAISRLESIGLLKVRRGLGTFVGDRASLSVTTQLIRSAMAISPKDLLQVAEFRRLIECPCSRNAAERVSDAQLEELEGIYQDMMNSKENLRASMRKDFDLHLKIVEIGGNELMRNVLEVLQEFIFAAMVQTLDQPGLPKALGNQHLELLEAIKARDGARAERAAKAHMDLLATRLEFVAAQPKEKSTEAIARAAKSKGAGRV